jgi:hypothetical protein
LETRRRRLHLKHLDLNFYFFIMKHNYTRTLVAWGLPAIATLLTGMRRAGRWLSTARPLAAACLLLLLSALGARAQQRPAPSLFQEDGEARTAAAGSRLSAALYHSRALTLDVFALQAALATAPLETRRGAAALALSLPLPDGSTGRYLVLESPIMAPGLAAQFPSIKTYSGRGLDDPTATVRLDFTPQGFHAQIITPGKTTVYIDPVSLTDQRHYLSFYRHDMDRSASYNRLSCGVHTTPTATTAGGGLANRTATPMAIGTQLRTYRLVVAATGEYTATKGGTVAGAQAAIVTTVNRVVGVYELELAVRLVLVPNNTSVVYTNAATDPYTDNDPNALLSQNQTNLDAVIGSANYDIGHVFTTGGGGLAFLGVVCQNSFKAQGETGLPNPSGDVFAIDFVAHEMGHQFGANHTFNSGSANNCIDDATVGTRNANTAYEPGSGSTIMAYAGICAPDNIQNNSDAYFHVVSFEEIETYLNGTSCAATAATANLVPSITTLPANGKVLPISTPFKLTAAATDGNGDALTYCWEEYDLGPAGSPIAPQVAGQTNPLFRSFLPNASPTRYFPRLSDLVANTSNVGERLPTVTRALNFRVTVRDQHNGSQGVVGGIRSSTVVSMSATSAAGPFLVTAPNTAVNWAGNSTQTVTWSVAGTTANGVNCATVNILLSTDGGLSYPTTVLAGTTNDGSASVTVPNVATTQARIMVEAADNYFFDISNANFTITATPLPTITSLNPTSGLVGASVTITGTNFTGATAVSFNGTAASFTVVNATTITTTVPGGATTGNVTVTTPGGTSNGVNFTVTPPAPTISSFTPGNGPVGTGVTITGTNFTGVTAVSFNGTAASFTVNSATSISTSVPATATTGTISVTTPGGTATSASSFLVTPVISSLNPASGLVGTSVTITGTTFTGTTGVSFNGTAASFTVVNNTTITTNVPVGATTGNVTVTTPGGTSNGINFTVTPPAPTAPTITSFTPGSGPVGTVVTITGTNLTGATDVSFNGTAASFTVNSTTSITATVPGAATTGLISVTTPDGTGSSVTAFLVTPVISSLNPTSGPVGTVVVIVGASFTGTTGVSFNGTAAPGFVVNSNNSITVSVPSGASTGNVTVTTPGGTSNGVAFTVTASPPTISSFTPGSGPVGTVVTITGTNLTGATDVSFNGTAATAFTVNSATSITATVPVGATTGLISVTTPGGTANSGSNFTVTVVLPDLIVSTTTTIPAGAYNNITVTGTGHGTLAGPVSALGAVTVQSGGSLDDGCQLLTGSGSFTLAAGATLNVCSPLGISASGPTGAILVTGTRSFSPDASYAYDGTLPQLTGDGLPASVLNLTIDNAASVNLSQGLSVRRVLTITTGDLNLGNSNLLLPSNATGTAMVVNSGSGRVQHTGTGRATMQRDISPSTGYSGPGYRHYSSPVASTPISDLAVPGVFTPLVNPAYNTLPTPSLPPSQFPNVFDYQESRLTAAFPAFDAGWHSPSSTAEVLAPTKGYTVNISPAATVDLTGLLNTGTLNTGALTRSFGPDAGWQFLGNPYPSPLDWRTVETTPGALPTGLAPAIYVFEPSSQYGGFYRSFVNNVGTGGFDGVLAAMQGFFIRSTQNVPAGFSFQDAYRVTTYQDPAFHRSTSADPRPLLRLTVSGAGAATTAAGTDETVVYFEAGANDAGFDQAFDAPKLPNLGAVLSLASQMPGAASQPLAINALAPQTTTTTVRVPLTLSAPTAGTYRFALGTLDNFGTTMPVTLVDNLTQARTDLRLTPIYAFTLSQAGSSNGRFELLLGRPSQVTATTAHSAADFSVWPNPTTGKAPLHVQLSTPAKAATLTLHTLLGQVVSTTSFSGSSADLPTTGLAAGTYLLTVRMPGEPSVTRRVVVE